MAQATGRPISEVLLQPADLTLWTFYQWVDSERVEGHRERLGRFDLSTLIAAATYDGKAFQREHGAFMHELTPHPNPEIDAQIRAAAIKRASRLIETAPGIFGKREE